MVRQNTEVKEMKEMRRRKNEGRDALGQSFARLQYKLHWVLLYSLRNIDPVYF